MQSAPPSLLFTAFPIAFPFVFVGLWLATLAWLSRRTRWAELARRFPGTEVPVGTPVRGAVFQFGGSGEKGATSFIAAPTGLYLWHTPIFRFRHEPIFVPWSRIRHIGQRRRDRFEVQLLDLDGVADIGIKTSEYAYLASYLVTARATPVT